jgi:hypothetical protein
MHSPRFTFPHPEESPNSLKNLNLIITCLQDPRRLELITPTIRDAEKLISHIGASVHPGVLAMAWDALRENKPLDKGLISLTSPTSRATIEERETLVWHDDTSTVCREITIRRLAPTEGSMSVAEESNCHDAGDHFHLEVTLSRTDTGAICVGVQWEGGSEAESMASLNKRWEKIQGVFTLLGEECAPWDLLPFAVEKSDRDDDDTYKFQRVRLYATLFPAELVELELKQEREAQARAEREDSDDRDTERDEDDETWGDSSYTSEFERDEDDEVEANDDEFEEGDSLPYSSQIHTPDQSLTILNPTPSQISRIANLSQMPLTPEIIEEVMAFTRKGSPLMPEAFEGHSSRALRDLAIHRRTTFTMDRSLSTTHFYDLVTYTAAEDLPDPSLAISLSVERLPLPGEEPFIKSLFEWTAFCEVAKIENWDRILRIAKDRR